MSGLVYYILDLETNGLKTNYHEITEVGIVRASDRVQLCRNIKCDYPERSSFDALQLTGKTLADLEIGISKKQAIEDVNTFFADDGLTPNGRCIVGHNIWSFDRRFLHQLWESFGQEFPAHYWLDTIHLTKNYLDIYKLPDNQIVKTATGKTSTKLEAACKMLNVKTVAGKHTAKSDSRNTYLLWKKLIEDYKIDYLPYLKSMPHIIAKSEDDEELM